MTGSTGRGGLVPSAERGSHLPRKGQLSPQQHRTVPVWPGPSWPAVTGWHPATASCVGVGSRILAWAVWPGRGKGLRAHGLTELRRSHGSVQTPGHLPDLWSLGPLPPAVWLQHPLTRGPGVEPIMGTKACEPSSSWQRAGHEGSVWGLETHRGDRGEKQTVPSMGLTLPACTAALLPPHVLGLRQAACGWPGRGFSMGQSGSFVVEPNQQRTAPPELWVIKRIHTRAGTEEISQKSRLQKPEVSVAV